MGRAVGRAVGRSARGRDTARSRSRPVGRRAALARGERAHAPTCAVLPGWSQHHPLRRLRRPRGCAPGRGVLRLRGGCTVPVLEQPPRRAREQVAGSSGTCAGTRRGSTSVGAVAGADGWVHSRFSPLHRRVGQLLRRIRLAEREVTSACGGRWMQRSPVPTGAHRCPPVHPSCRARRVAGGCRRCSSALLQGPGWPASGSAPPRAGSIVPQVPRLCGVRGQGRPAGAGAELVRGGASLVLVHLVKASIKAEKVKLDASLRGTCRSAVFTLGHQACAVRYIGVAAR